MLVMCFVSFAKNRNAENGRELRDAIRKNKEIERKETALSEEKICVS
jgi:hypothetical protein